MSERPTTKPSPEPVPIYSDKRQKRVVIRGVEFSIALDAGRVARLKRGAGYRNVVQPALRLLGSRDGRSNGHPAHLAENGGTHRVPTVAAASAEAREMLDRIAGIEWYHSIELPHGVVTPGFVDHRPQLAMYDLPADMRGMRALDVATYDGFWAFEMERRGAEVVAIDIGAWSQFDIPLRELEEWRRSGGVDKVTGAGFRVARDLLGSRVDRRVLSVYDLTPEQLGTFDLVFISDLLLHLRDPQRALERVASVVRPFGTAVVADVYNPRLEAIGDLNLSEYLGYAGWVWWRPAPATLKTMMRVAGFKRVDEIARLVLNATSDDPIHKVILKGYLSA